MVYKCIYIPARKKDIFFMHHMLRWFGGSVKGTEYIWFTYELHSVKEERERTWTFVSSLRVNTLCILVNNVLLMDATIQW